MAPVTELLLVRHGQSAGNVAREQALDARADVITIDQRDPDVPLTDLGVRQATSVGQWLTKPTSPIPDATFSSPYVRARQTAETALRSAGISQSVHLDERLRDRELGVLDLLTSDGVRAKFPEEVQRRAWLGKLHYRPPGGESWADVALRLRSFMTDLNQAAPSATRLLVVSHDAVIMLIRFVLEEWDEATLLDTAAQTEVANASVTHLVLDPDKSPRWVAASFNAVEHLTAAALDTEDRTGEAHGDIS